MADISPENKLLTTRITFDDVSHITGYKDTGKIFKNRGRRNLEKIYTNGMEKVYVFEGANNCPCWQTVKKDQKSTGLPGHVIGFIAYATQCSMREAWEIAREIGYKKFGPELAYERMRNNLPVPEEFRKYGKDLLLKKRNEDLLRNRSGAHTIKDLNNKETILSLDDIIKITDLESEIFQKEQESLRREKEIEFNRKNAATNNLGINAPEAVVQWRGPLIFPNLENTDFLKSRGFDDEIINHPNFKGTIGSTTGLFAPTYLNNTKFKESDLEFKDHLIIPYWNIHGINGDRSSKGLAGLEAKNRLNDEGFEKEINSLLLEGKSSDGARRNPSLQYQGSLRSSGICISNKPAKVNAIVLVEQFLDGMAHFKLNRNNHDREQSWYMAAGGGFGNNQLLIVKYLAQENKVKNIVLAVDKDPAGVNYSFKIIQELIPLRHPSELRFDAMVVDKEFLKITVSQDIRFDVERKERVKRRDDTNEYIKSVLKDTGMVDSKSVAYYPSNLLGSEQGRLLINLSKEKAENVVSFIVKLLKADENILKIDFAPNSKDWNDELLGVPLKEGNPSHYLLSAANKSTNGLFITASNKIAKAVYFLTPSDYHNETIGRINPFSSTPIEIDRLIDNPERLKSALDQLKLDFSKVPILNEAYFLNALRGDYQFDLFSKKLYNKERIDLGELVELREKENSEEISILKWKFIFTNEGKKIFNSKEINPIHWMVPNLEKYGDLNPIKFKSTKGSALFTFLIKDDIIYDPLTKVLLSKSDGKLGELVTRSESMNKQNWELKLTSLGTEAINKGSESPLRKIKETLELTGSLKKLTYDQEKIVFGFNELTLRPTTDRTEFKHEQLNQFKYQMLMIKLAMDSYFESYNEFREKYPQPLEMIQSKNRTLFVGQNKYSADDLERNPEQFGAVKFDLKTKGLIWNHKIFENVDTNPYFKNSFFWKSVRLFQENNGVFPNYLKNIKFNSKEHYNLFYKSTDLQIGRIINAGKENGKDVRYLQIFEGVPEMMRKELKAYLQHIPDATNDVLKRYGLGEVPDNIEARIKNPSIQSLVPLAYKSFFKNGKFVPKNDEELERLSTNAYEHYTKAYLWNLNNHGNKSDLQASVTRKNDVISIENNILRLNSLKFGFYDSDLDKLIVTTPPHPKFFPQIAVVERDVVKDPKHREFAKHLIVEQSETDQDKIKQQKLELASKIKGVKDGNGNVTFYFAEDINKFIPLAVVKNNVFYVSEEVTKFNSNIADLIKESANVSQMRIEYIDQIADQPKSVIQQTEPSNSSFDHTLKHTNHILDDILNHNSFKGLIEFQDGKMMVNLRREKGVTQIIHFGDENINKEIQGFFWNNPESPSAMIIAESVKEAFSLIQHEYPFSLRNQNLILVGINKSDKDLREASDRIAKAYNIGTIRIIGSDEFVNEKSTWAKKIVPQVAKLGIIPLEESLKRVGTYLSKYEADTKLPLDINSNGVLKPAEGLVLMPLENKEKSFAILGKLINYPDQPESYYSSIPLKEAKRVIICQSPEEAYYYQLYNKDFLSGTAVVATLPKYIKEGSNKLGEAMNFPHLSNQITIANTNGLFSYLSNLKFPHLKNAGIETAANEGSFKELYKKDIDKQEEMLKESRKIAAIRNSFLKPESPPTNRVLIDHDKKFENKTKALSLDPESQ